MHRFRKFIIWSIVVVLLFIATLAMLAAVFSENVKSIVIKEINKNLTAEVSVTKINFSFLSNFPYASVDFNNVKILENENLVSSGYILSGERVSLLINPLDIISKNYTIKKIKLSNATINLQVDKNGKTNYEIWKIKNDTASNNFSLELNEVVFSNVDVLYYNSFNNQDHRFIIKDGTLSGEFSKTNFEITTSADLYAEKLIVNSTNYISEKNCLLNLSIDIDTDRNTYKIKNSDLKIAGLSAAITGDVTKKKEGVLLDLVINSENADIPSLLTVLPNRLTNKANDYNYTGDVSFECRIKGISSISKIPIIDIKFSSKNSSISPKSTSYKLSDINVSGRYSNYKNESSPVEYLQLDKFDATLEGEKITGSLLIQDFSRPLINLNAVVAADLAAMSKFYLPDTLEYIKGHANASIEFNGIAGEKSTYQSTGDIKLQDVEFKVKQKPVKFKNVGGLFHLNGNDIIIEKLTAKVGKSDFNIKGSFINLVSWLLKDSRMLKINAAVSSGYMNLDELLSKNTNSTQSESNFRLSISQYLQLNLDISIDKFNFRKFEATSVKGSLLLKDQTLQTQSLVFNTSGGKSTLVGMIKDIPGDSLRINYNAKISKLNITQLFKEMGNFGQQTITDSNLKGRVSADILFRSMWSKSLEINSKSIVVQSSFEINDGELLNFTPMLELQEFLKGSDLYRIKFSTMTNTIEIKNESIYIPMMEIKSSALDFKINGTHSFDNIVDYKLRLYLSQITGKKVKEMNTEFGTIEEDGYGRPMVFISMKGPVNNPIFKYDRKAVEQKITEDIKKEAQSLKKILKEEFRKKNHSNITNEGTDNSNDEEELEIDWDDDDE
jgi:AsmA-like protein